MAVYVHNITVNQGTTFELDLNVEGTQTNAPKDLTGYSVSADLKKTYTSKTKIAFGATISTPSEELFKYHWHLRCLQKSNLEDTFTM